MNPVFTFFDRLANWFSPDYGELNPRERTSRNMLPYVSLITTVFSLFYVAFSAWIGFSHGVWLMLANFVLLWFGLFLLRTTGLFRLNAHLYLVNSTFVAIMGCSFFSGGLNSPVTPWFTLIPMGAVLLFGYSRDALLWLLIAGALPVGYGVAVMSGYEFKVHFLPEYTTIFSIMCLAGLVLILFLVAMAFDYNRSQVMERLEEQNIALEQAHKEAEEAKRMLEKLASIDTVTNVANRRAFDIASSEEWQRCQRKKRPISFIMIDVDQFKQYNDNYGHAAGDECLVRIASAINNCIHRPGDTFARYGGEEFAAIMPDTNSEGALHMAQKFHAAIADLAIPHDYSSVSHYITISIGVATTDWSSDITLEEISASADKMLYQAKESGRNMTRSIQI